MVDTALHRHLAACGAVLADDRGVELPRHFGDPAAEYAALREQAALLDLGFRTLIRVVGADRVAFLQGMLTADVAALAPGGGCPALLLTIQGRVTADVRVAALADALLLDVDVRARDALVAALEKLIIADDVTLEPPAEPVTLLGLEGPAAAQLLGPDAAALPAWAHTTTAIAGVTVRALRASEVRGPGFVLHVPAAAATEVWPAPDPAAWRRSRAGGSRSVCRASGSTWTGARSRSRCPSRTRSARRRGATSDRRWWRAARRAAMSIAGWSGSSLPERRRPQGCRCCTKARRSDG